MGTVSVCGSVVTSARVSPEAYGQYLAIRDDAFDDCEHISEHRRYVLDRCVREIAPYYIPTALLLIGGLAAFAASTKMLSTRAAGAAAAYALAEKTIEGLDAYRDEVIERYGEEVDAEIRESASNRLVSQEVVERSRGYFSDDDLANRFPHTNHDVLWYDLTADRWFWATKEDILKGQTKVNQLVQDYGVANIGDFYNEIACYCDGPISRSAGWREDGRVKYMDIIFGSKTDEVNYGLAVNTIFYECMSVDPRVLERN